MMIALRSYLPSSTSSRYILIISFVIIIAIFWIGNMPSFETFKSSSSSKINSKEIVHNHSVDIDVKKVLAELSLESYAYVLAKEEIDGNSLLLLTNHDLEGMGIPLGPRKKILNHIQSKDHISSSMPKECHALPVRNNTVVGTSSHNNPTPPPPTPTSPVITENPAFRDYKSEISKRSNNIAVCSMVHRLHAPYLAEWIEFHLLPRVGFSHFYLYHDHKDLTTSLEQEFPLGSPVKLAVQKYIDAGVLTLRENWPPRPEYPNYEEDISVDKGDYDSCLSTFQAKDRAGNEGLCQGFTFAHCLYSVKKNKHDWVAVFDVDEFIFSEKFESVDHYIQHLDPGVSHISMSPAMFGPNGFIVDEPFLVDKVKLRSFVINALDRRSMMPEKGEQVDKGLYPGCNINSHTRGFDNNWPVCNDSGGKSIVKVSVSGRLRIHGHDYSDGRGVHAERNQLRFNHYQFRSIQDAYERYQVSKKMTTVQVAVLAGPYLDAIKDRMVADAVAVDLYGRLGWQIPTRQSWSSINVVYDSEDRVKQGWPYAKYSTIGGPNDGL